MTHNIYKIYLATADERTETIYSVGDMAIIRGMLRERAIYRRLQLASK